MVGPSCFESWRVAVTEPAYRPWHPEAQELARSKAEREEWFRRWGRAGAGGAVRGTSTSGVPCRSKRGEMKAQPNRYSISVAPTGRARCRACKGLVARGKARIVTLAIVCERPRRVTKFVRHAECVDAAFARVVLLAHGSAEDVPVVGAVDMEMVDGVRANLQRVANV